MHVKKERFINNEEYCSLFRIKSYRSAFIIAGIFAAAIFAMIIVGKNTDILCNTNFFHIISDDPAVINTSEGSYSGKEYSVNINSTAIENNILSVNCDLISSYGKSQLSPENIYVIKYNSDGGSNGSISYPAASSSFSSSEDNENIVNVRLNFTIDKINGNYSDYIFCLRIDTDSADKLINILLDIDI